jgi:hypothetical protein
VPISSSTPQSSERRPQIARRIFTAAALLLAIAIPFRAQEERPLLRVQDDCTAFGYAPDGRIAYSTREIFHVKKATYERDDIWIVAPNGNKRRLIEGEKFVRGDTPLSYSVRAFHWSPDSKQLAVELLMTKFTNAHGDVTQGTQTLLLDDAGHEIKVPGGDSLVPSASDVQWLSDDDAIVYLTQTLSASGPNTVTELHTTSGTKAPLFDGHWFAAVAWEPQLRGGVGVETANSRAGTIKLVWLDLEHQTIRDLANLDAFVSGLTISPSGRRVAYFIDPEVIEIRDLDAPQRVARAHVGMGTYFWAPDDSHILLKRGPERESRDITWIELPPLSVPAPRAAIPIPEVNPQPIFHDLEYPEFAISPDGRDIAIVDPGKGNLSVYPLP